MNYICLNGEILPRKHARLSFDNRAFRYGEAVVELMRSSGIRVPFYPEHFKRLTRALQVLGLSHAAAFSESSLLRSIELLIHRKKLFKINKITLTVWREDDPILLSHKTGIHYLIEAEALDESQFMLNERGLIADIFPGAYKAKSYLSPFCTNDQSFKFQAKRYAEQSHFDACLLTNPEGNIVEEAEGNVFFVNGKTIYTPSVESGCVDGIIRNKVIEMAKEGGGIINEVKVIPMSFLREVEEIFITNDLYGIRWIAGYKDVKRYRKRRSVDFVAGLNRLFS